MAQFQDSLRNPVGRYSQATVQEKARQTYLPDRSRALGLAVQGKVKNGGVLYGQNHRLVLYFIQNRLSMGIVYCCRARLSWRFCASGGGSVELRGVFNTGRSG